MSSFRLIAALIICGCLASQATSREWTDSTGKYSVEADLIAFNEETAVLKKQNHELVAVPIEKLSKQDEEYLKSKDAAEVAGRLADQPQTWTMRSGLKVVGKVVAYGARTSPLSGGGARFYVNDRLFDNLPEVYRRMLPKIVAHFENINIDDKKGLDSWVRKQKGEPRTFTCEGVMLELAGGDEYAVPFFFFSDDDLKVLQPGWTRWTAADKDKARKEQETFLLQAEAQAYQRDRMANQQIALMQLQTQTYSAGLFDLWEVRLLPKPGVPSPPLSVVVPAKDSRTAMQEALGRNPGFVAGGAVKVRR